MNDHITKPINVDDMFSTMAQWIVPATAAGPASAAREPLPESIPRIVGIDAAAGLATTAGNTNLYRRLLLKFREAYGDFDEQFHAAGQDTDEAAPLRAAHTLKGVAANIGAKGVADAARALEGACASGEPDSGLSALLARVCCELDPVIEALGVLQPDEAVPAEQQAVDGDRLQELLTSLCELLEDCDADAAERVEELRPMLASMVPASEFRSVAKLVDSYEFDDALVIVQGWVKVLVQAPL